MSENFLLLNSDNTEMLVIASAKQRHHFDQVTVTLDNCVISQSSTVKNLGVTFDSALQFELFRSVHQRNNQDCFLLT